jgi:PAS domain S-box-containing protein
LFVNAVQDYAIYVLDAEGHIASWNRGAQRIKGYAASEIIGQHFSVFFTEQDRMEGKPLKELQTAEREGQYQGEGWRVRKDGSQFWASVVLTAIKDGNGKLAGFAKITHDFTERMQAQERLQRANTDLNAEMKERLSAQEKLADSEKSLRELSLHLLKTQDEERKRIGRELHDSLGQYLAILKMNLDSLDADFVGSHNGASKQVAQCIRLVEDSIKEVRTISYLLYPPMLEEVGLKSAIPWYLEGFSKRSNIETTFEIDPEFGRLEREVELALFRVLQESLTNVHRHSGSKTANIRLSRQNGNAILQVSDKGTGIPPSLLEHSDKDWLGSLGVGLRGMNERIRQLGGKLEISSTESGTVVTADVPITESVPAVANLANAD